MTWTDVHRNIKIYKINIILRLRCNREAALYDYFIGPYTLSRCLNLYKLFLWWFIPEERRHTGTSIKCAVNLTFVSATGRISRQCG